MAKGYKRATLLLAFGCADTAENIAPFLSNIFRGRPVSDDLVERTKARYALIGGQSPLLSITRAQARAIEEILKKDEPGHRVYVGMRYWHPYIKDTMAEMKADGVELAAAVVMAPFASPVATGGYDKEVEDSRRAQGGLPEVTHITNWHIHPEFIKILVDNIKDAMSVFEDKDDCLVVFSSHSLPKEMLEGDAYEMKYNQTVAEIVKRLPCDYRIAFQSQGGGQFEWLGPKVEDVIEEAKKAGKKGVVVAPVGFAADHIETLYDIDVNFRGTAESRGLVFRRAASLNTNPRFIALLADLINKYGVRG